MLVEWLIMSMIKFEFLFKGAEHRSFRFEWSEIEISLFPWVFFDRGFNGSFGWEESMLHA